MLGSILNYYYKFEYDSPLLLPYWAKNDRLGQISPGQEEKETKKKQTVSD